MLTGQGQGEMSLLGRWPCEGISSGKARLGAALGMALHCAEEDQVQVPIRTVFQVYKIHWTGFRWRATLPRDQADPTNRDISATISLKAFPGRPPNPLSPTRLALAFLCSVSALQFHYQLCSLPATHLRFLRNKKRPQKEYQKLRKNLRWESTFKTVSR